MNKTLITKLSLKELYVLRTLINERIEILEEKQAAVRSIEELMAEKGLHASDLLELLPEQSQAHQKTVPPKYRHPIETQITWSGRGKEPKWFRDALSAGYTIEKLLVNN